jgi:hypothetical protein
MWLLPNYGRIIMGKVRKKVPPPYFYSGEHEAKDRDEAQDETMDPYDTSQREKMLADDEMTPAEEGFMMGREQEPPSKKETRRKAVSHDDTTSVELAKADSEDS